MQYFAVFDLCLTETAFFKPKDDLKKFKKYVQLWS